MLNETPEVSTVKTKSAHKAIRQLWWAVTAIVLVILCAVLWYSRYNQESSGIRLVSGERTYYLATATSKTAQEKGLSGRSAMPPNQGMLFIFPRPVVQCFWMKDMRFPLDMVWLSADKTVVYIVPNVSPDSYPVTFCPSLAASYVIELNVGQVAASRIIMGRTLHF